MQGDRRPHALTGKSEQTWLACRRGAELVFRRNRDRPNFFQKKKTGLVVYKNGGEFLPIIFS
jgi:hypothetical protein